MPFDVLASVRSTALVAIVSASFASPILVKADAFAGSGDGAKPVPTETLVAGGVEFALPESWGRLGASAAAGSGEAERIGTVVSGICPGGSAGATCVDGVQITFVAYSGKQGHELPKLADFEAQLKAQLAREFRGYRVVDSATRTSDAGVRWLDHQFTWASGDTRVTQRFAAYRHDDGSGVVATITGASADHAKAIDAFLASGAVVGEH